MGRMHHHWKRVPRRIRQPLVLVVGCIFILVGIAGLALPIIPGWAGIFLGFAILATEFAFAERVRDRFVAFLKQLGNQAEQVWHRLRHK